MDGHKRDELARSASIKRGARGSCGKWVYESRKEARDAIKRIKARSNYRSEPDRMLAPYRCGRCGGGYHVGHTWRVAISGIVAELSELRARGVA